MSASQGFAMGVMISILVSLAGCGDTPAMRSADERFGTLVDSFTTAERVTAAKVAELRTFVEQNYQAEEISYQLSYALSSVAGCGEEEALKMQRMLCLRLRDAYRRAKQEHDNQHPTLPAVLEELSADYRDLETAIGPTICNSSQDTIQLNYDWLDTANVQGPSDRYLKVSGIRLNTVGRCEVALVSADKTTRQFAGAQFSIMDSGRQLVLDLTSIPFRRDDVEMTLTLFPPARQGANAPPAYQWSLPADAWRLDWTPDAAPRKVRITATKIDIFQDGSNGDAGWNFDLFVAIGSSEPYKMSLFVNERLSDGPGNSANTFQNFREGTKLFDVRQGENITVSCGGLEIDGDRAIPGPTTPVVLRPAQRWNANGSVISMEGKTGDNDIHYILHLQVELE